MPHLHRPPELPDVLLTLAQELHNLHEHFHNELSWRKSHVSFATKQDLIELENRIMKTQQELITDLKAVSVQQQKTVKEIADLQAATNVLKTQIADLTAQVTTGNIVTQELVDAVAEVKNQAQIVDDLIPDAPVVVPTP